MPSSIATRTYQKQQEHPIQNQQQKTHLQQNKQPITTDSSDSDCETIDGSLEDHELSRSMSAMSVKSELLATMHNNMDDLKNEMSGLKENSQKVSPFNKCTFYVCM